MLLKIAKVEDNSKNEKILKCLAEKKEITPGFDSSNVLLYFSLKDESKLKIIPLMFESNLFFLLNTFENNKITKFKSLFENATSLSLSIMVFSSDSLKRMLNENGKIVEITAIIHDFVTDEISISGSDLRSSEFYDSIINKGEIKKLVMYLDEPTKNLQALIKIFSDGRISIIPELEFVKVKSLLSYLLERLKIE